MPGTLDIGAAGTSGHCWQGTRAVYNWALQELPANMLGTPAATETNPSFGSTRFCRDTGIQTSGCVGRTTTWTWVRLTRTCDTPTRGTESEGHGPRAPHARRHDAGEGRGGELRRNAARAFSAGAARRPAEDVKVWAPAWRETGGRVRWQPLRRNKRGWLHWHQSERPRAKMALAKTSCRVHATMPQTLHLQGGGARPRLKGRGDPPSGHDWDDAAERQDSVGWGLQPSGRTGLPPPWRRTDVSGEG